MINNVAYVINEISSITGHPPVKKALQKFVFLLQTKGVNLGFDYTLHFYGPYCAELDHETTKLSSDGIISFDYSGYGHKMTVVEESIETVDADLGKHSLQIVKEVIERYKEKTPSELELLTTAIYAHEHTNAKTKDEVARNVKRIKGEKYNDQEIGWALNEFRYFGIAL